MITGVAGSMVATGQGGEVSGSGTRSGSAHLDQDAGFSATRTDGDGDRILRPEARAIDWALQEIPRPGEGHFGARRAPRSSRPLARHLCAETLKPPGVPGTVGVPLGTAVLSNVLKSSASAFAQIITSAGGSRTGPLVLAPVFPDGFEAHRISGSQR